VAYSPHAGTVEAQKPRNEIAQQQLTMFSPPLASHRTLLGDAVNTGLHDSTQRRVLPHVRFRVYRRD
jgi:hypothetical protein